MMLLSRPLVSVVIASYNHAAFVEEAVRSVLDQGINEIEVIVVDDGSSDSTPDRVEAIADRRVKLIRLPENRQQHPRNLALQLAKGRYVAFQNSDDVWQKGKLKAQIQKLESDKNLAASFTAVELIDKHGRPTSGWLDGIFLTENRTSSRWLRHFFDKGNCLCLVSAVVRRANLKKTGIFRPSLVQLSDLDLWIRLTSTGGFYVHQRRYTKMRMLAKQNLSYPSPASIRRSSIEFSEVLQRYLKQPVLDLVPEAFKDVLSTRDSNPASYYVGLANHALVIGDPAHRRFADYVLAKVIDDPKLYRRAVDVFGPAFFKEFIKKRGGLETVIK